MDDGERAALTDRDLNGEYRRRRLEAKFDGITRFPSYATVRARLREQIADRQPVDLERVFSPSSR